MRFRTNNNNNNTSSTQQQPPFGVRANVHSGRGSSGNHQHRGPQQDSQQQQHRQAAAAAGTPPAAAIVPPERVNYFVFEAELIANPHYGRQSTAGTTAEPEDRQIPMRSKCLIRRMVNTVGCSHGFADVTPPSSGVGSVTGDGSLRQDWTHAKDAVLNDNVVWLKPTSSPHRRPSIFFSRRRVTPDSAPPGSVMVPISELGRAAPLFKITSQTCEYFALRLPMLKAGFKRIADAESLIDANVLWGKSWSSLNNRVPPIDQLVDKLVEYRKAVGAVFPGSSSSSGVRSAGGGSGALFATARDFFSNNTDTVGLEFCKRPVHRFQKINHFSGSHKNLGCKSGLAKNLQVLADRNRSNPEASNFAPQTFRLPEELHRCIEAVNNADPKTTYIIKPSRGSCGRGLRIFRAGDEDARQILEDAVQPRTRQQHQEMMLGKSQAQLMARLRGNVSGGGSGGGAAGASTALVKAPPYVVQEYIENPLLVDGRKFDFRVYVVVTSYDPLVCYVHHSGLVRFAAKQYEDADIRDFYSHLTNYSVGRKLEAEVKLKNKAAAAAAAATAEDVGVGKQRNNADDDDDDDSTSNASSSVANSSSAKIIREQQQQSNNNNNTSGGSMSELELKWSMERMNHFLARKYGEAQSADIWCKIDDLIAKTLMACQQPVVLSSGNVGEGSHDASIEVTGFDIMLCEERGGAVVPKLIEVNTLPSLESSSHFDYNVKSNLITDMLNLSQLQLFDRDPSVFAPLEAVAAATHNETAAEQEQPIDKVKHYNNGNDDDDDADSDADSDNSGNAAVVPRKRDTSYLNAPSTRAQPFVHPYETVFDDPRIATTTTADDNSGGLESQDSDLALLLRSESTTEEQQRQILRQRPDVPALLRPRQKSFVGRRLPRDQDCEDTVCRVRDELQCTGGFRLLFPTPDRVERLGNLVHPDMRASPRNQALWQAVKANPAEFSKAAEVSFLPFLGAAKEAEAMAEGGGRAPGDDL